MCLVCLHAALPTQARAAMGCGAPPHSEAAVPVRSRVACGLVPLDRCCKTAAPAVSLQAWLRRPCRLLGRPMVPAPMGHRAAVDPTTAAHAACSCRPSDGRRCRMARRSTRLPPVRLQRCRRRWQKRRLRRRATTMRHARARTMWRRRARRRVRRRHRCRVACVPFALSGRGTWPLASARTSCACSVRRASAIRAQGSRAVHFAGRQSRRLRRWCHLNLVLEYCCVMMIVTAVSLR